MAVNQSADFNLVLIEAFASVDIRSSRFDMRILFPVVFNAEVICGEQEQSDEPSDEHPPKGAPRLR